MKNNYFLLNKEQQRTVLEQAAIRKILPKQAVEKDLWVTAILQIVFALPCSVLRKKAIRMTADCLNIRLMLIND